MIVQGAEDPNVTMDNVNEVIRELDANGIQYETLIFPDEGHGVVKTLNKHTMLREMERFFDSSL